MKKTLILIISITIFSLDASAQRQKNFSKQFMPVWNNATEYTLEVAKQMPEEYYGYRAGDELLTFGQLLTHIAENVSWITSTYVLSEENPLKGDDYDHLDKDEVIALLEESFKYASKSINNLNDLQVARGVKFAGNNLTVGKMIYLMRDHMTHHRAQAIIYLRMNGEKPPRYVGW